ncbi:class I SAM-dependent methyltransferase [Alteraurantiacibacter aestuarii]|uniref:Methyltransferase domain-containing protein n=1 Tax=Alteraurantiacibacter aestuarii TaxID=650004 RepID=A0A844ZJF3_9SPHN|nr:class I SAM-dependent methyltransferase [Alteraurantiacibacter aestuarii]MXO87908.1 methyltransferase domain-containing protein [Alteraurantiacibacter aestuarii]
MIDAREHNRIGWNQRVEDGDMWSIPVDAETIARARKGDWDVLLTPTKPVPREWFGDIAGKDMLGLASGGGQQCPVFAAAGANVSCLDASEGQLGRDAEVAEREGLHIRTVQGFMHDLSAFEDASFDIVFNPCSTAFAPEVMPVWRECARVLRPGGILMTGFYNPVFFVFDQLAMDRGELVARHALPYSDFELPEDEREKMLADDPTLCFSHTLETQIGGQLQAGLMLSDMFEDGWAQLHELSALFPPFIATRAVKRG